MITVLEISRNPEQTAWHLWAASFCLIPRWLNKFTVNFGFVACVVNMQQKGYSIVKDFHSLHFSKVSNKYKTALNKNGCRDLKSGVTAKTIWVRDRSEVYYTQDKLSSSCKICVERWPRSCEVSCAGGDGDRWAAAAGGGRGGEDKTNCLCGEIRPLMFVVAATTLSDIIRPTVRVVLRNTSL